MFDIGFSELMVIAVVALVVIGPERLPRVARTVGHLMGRLQRYVNDVKADINREMELEELRKFKDQFEQTAQSAQTQFDAEINKAQEVVNSINSDLSPHGESASITSTNTNAAMPETGPGLESLQGVQSVGTLPGVVAEQKPAA